MIGTIVNVCGIIAGTLIGLLIKKGIPERIKTALMKVQGVAIVLIGINGVIVAMLFIDADGSFQVSGTLLLLTSLILGCICGELIRIDDGLDKMCAAAERKFGASGISQGFITATMIYAVGALTIIGALNDGLSGDHTLLFTKTGLDFVTSIILATSLGIGVMFAAIPVLIVQGSISLLAGVLAPYVTDEPIRLLSMVGFAIVVAIGINFIGNAKIRVANLLPALLVPIIYYYLILGLIVPLFG